jgi:hypothetical protein
MDSPQTAWKRNHDNVAQFHQQQQQQQQQQQRGIKMGTASLSKTTAAAAVPLPPKQHKQQQHQQQQQQKPVPSVRRQTPPSPTRDSSHPVQLPPKTKIRQKVREEQLQQQKQQQQLNYDSTDVYDEQTEDEMIEASVTDADEVGGYFRNLAMIR